MRKKLLSLLLAALMILGLLPAAALAAEGDTPPTLAEGVEESVKKYGFEGIAWELDLSTIFTDADGDRLTYKVSVNGADPVEAAEKYSYVCGAANATLKFTANDGKADSDKTYTVTLYVEPKTKLLLESGSSEVAVGTPFTLAMSTIFENGYGVTVYVSINGADKEFVNSGNVKSVTFSRAFANPGVYTLEFYEKHGPTFVGPYTHTLTVTGEAIENHAPVVQNPTEGPGQLGSSVNVTYWKPDLASIFSDPDGNTLTYSYSIDGSNFSEYYPSVGIHADYLKPDGTHTVTIRATDPYGEYAEFTVTIEKSTNHLPTKKADAPGKLSVFVPVGLTYKVDANLYYEDVDAKDQGKLRFLNNRFQSAGSYTASTVGDTKTETAYGADSVDRSVDGIEITYTAIGIDKEDTAITNGETYSLNLAELNFPGNYKVRINGGAEQDAAESYTFTPSKPGKYFLHFYGSQTKTAEQNYVVKLTVLPNGTEPAPMTVTIGEKNYDVKLTALVGSKSWFGGPGDVPFYLTAVPADFETLTLTVDKQDNTVKEVVCGEFEPVEGSGTVYTVKNHTCFTGDLDVNVSDVIDTSKYGVIPVLIQDTTEQYTGLLIQVGEPKPNTPPTLAEGVETSVKSYGYEDIAWELDLSTIFYDADGDDLTYKVSVNDGEFEAADAKYSYTPATTENSVKLIFKANDGKVESSDTYIVKLDVKHTPTRLVESGSGSAAAGAYANVYLDNVFQDDASIFTDFDYYVSIDGGEEFFFLRSAKRGAQFSRAFETVGEHTLKFRAALGPLFSDVYTYTLTVTGESVTNYKPYILDTAKDEERTEAMWTGGGSYYTNWKPDLSKVFGDDLKDTGDNGEQSRLTFTFKDDKDPSFRTYYPNTGYATGASKSRVGERTVTFRATDPYGEYVEWVTHVTVMEDHKATRKEGVQEAYTFEVPFGATITLNAEDYFEDNDSKDIENGVRFCNAVSHATYKPYTYVANDSNDYVIRMVGYSGNDWGSESVTFTFRTVMPTSWPTITGLSAATLHGVANSDTGAEDGKVNVKSVTVTQYDSLRLENGKVSAGLILIRMDEDVDALERPYYELSGETADAVVSTGAAIGAELKEDITLNAENNYRLAQAVSVSQNIENETYGNYTLTTYYDFMLVGVNARPILAGETASVREKITLGDTWTLNLDGLFSDADGDPLTYKVSVNGAEAVVIEGSTYTLTPEDGVHTLVFTANDGKVGSTDTYTVTLLTRRPNAPAWPQVLEYSIERVRTYSGGTVYFPIAKTDLVQYDALVTENSKTYVGEIVLYVTDADFASRNWYATDKDTATVKITNGATTTAANAITIRKSSGAFVSSSDVKVTEDGQTYYYYMKAVQAETPAFEPAIGNGTAAGTTENNVTTFPAGSGSGAPTVTVTAPASGWAAGENTFTVACDKACVVLVKSGETYTKLAAANSGETHSFTANLAEGDEIIVRLKGDVNGDGIVNALDATLVSRACLSTTHGAYKAFDALSTCAVGTPSALVAMQINRACLSETHAAYQAMTW